MVGIGEKCLLVPYQSGGGTEAAIFPYRLPAVGDRVLIIIVAGKTTPFFLKPYRVYVGDRILMLPVNGNPDNVVFIADVGDYLPETWQTGFTQTCTGPDPVGKWHCAPGCLFNSFTNPCSLDHYTTVDRTLITFCLHETYADDYWKKNVSVGEAKYSWIACANDGACSQYPCGTAAQGFSGEASMGEVVSMGCSRIERKARTETPGETLYFCAAGSNICPNYNGGRGQESCTAKGWRDESPPDITEAVSTKPDACGDPNSLTFSWEAEPASDENNVSCLFRKASEVIEVTADSAMDIQCKFRSPSGSDLGSYNPPSTDDRRTIPMTPMGNIQTGEQNSYGDVTSIVSVPGGTITTQYWIKPPAQTSTATLYKSHTKRT